MRRKLPLEYRSLTGQKVTFVSIFIFQLSPWDTFCVLPVAYITSIEEFRRGIRKPTPCIKWKILIQLSVSEAMLARRRKTNPVHSDATRQCSAKTP